jgi:hypothetical protein
MSARRHFSTRPHQSCCTRARVPVGGLQGVTMPTSGDAYLKAVPPRECGEFISQSQPNEPLINFILANSGRWPTSAGGTRAGVSVAQNCVGATEGDGTIAHLGRFFIAITCVYSFLNSKSEKGRPCARQPHLFLAGILPWSHRLTRPQATLSRSSCR